MKSLFLPVCSFIVGLAFTTLYFNSVKSDERLVKSLKSSELSIAFSKINEIKNDSRSPDTLRSPASIPKLNLMLDGVSLSKADLALLDKYKDRPRQREFAEAIILGAYSASISDEEYSNRMESFRKNLSHNPDESFSAALELKNDPDLEKSPLRKASIYMILTSIPGKEKDGMDLAIGESRNNVDVNELTEMGLSKDEKYNHMLLPVLAYEAAVGKMKDLGSDPYQETIRTLEAQSSADIRKGIVEKFEAAYPNYKGKIKI